MSKKYYRALSIAGSDSGGGAGVQADLKTFGALGCYGMTVITAVTAQNSCDVLGIAPVEPDMVSWQLHAVLSDMGADAIKLGMLFNACIIERVKLALEQVPHIPMVLDPVMISTSGRVLLEEPKALLTLFPRALLITPNLREAEHLLKRRISSRSQMEMAGAELLALGPAAVLMKGGHSAEAPGWDCLVLPNEAPIWFEGAFIDTPNTHGSGCTYSAAITAYLARGEPLISAVTRAKDYVQQAIKGGANYKLGAGHGPLHHYWDCHTWS